MKWETVCRMVCFCAQNPKITSCISQIRCDSPLFFNLFRYVFKNRSSVKFAPCVWEAVQFDKWSTNNSKVLLTLAFRSLGYWQGNKKLIQSRLFVRTTVDIRKLLKMWNDSKLWEIKVSYKLSSQTFGFKKQCWVVCAAQLGFYCLLSVKLHWLLNIY